MSKEHEHNREDTPTEAPLSLEQIGKDVRQMREDLQNIKHALSGDPYDRKNDPGALALMLEHRDDYYGNKEVSRMGTRQMTLKMWNGWTKITALAILIPAVAWCVEQYIQYKK
jgi:hypothetical protein